MDVEGKSRSSKARIYLIIVTGAVLLIAGLVWVVSGSFLGLVPFSLGVVLIVLEVILGLGGSLACKMEKGIQPGLCEENQQPASVIAHEGPASESTLWQMKMPWYVSSRPVIDILVGLAGTVWGAAWTSNARTMPYAGGLASNEILIMRTYSLGLLILCLLIFVLGIFCLARPVSYIAINVVLGILLMIAGLSIIPIAARVLTPGGENYLIMRVSIYFAALPFILAGLLIALMSLPVSRWVKKALEGHIEFTGSRAAAVAVSLAVLGVVLMAAMFAVLYWSEGPRRREEKEELSAKLENTTILRPAAAQGLVYVGKESNAYLFALDARSGEEVWRFETGSEVVGPPVISDGVVYSVVEGNGKVYALDASSGEELWRREFDDLRESFPVAGEGMVYISEHNGPLHALDAKTGETIWDDNTHGPMGDPALYGGVVYVLGEGGSGRVMYAMDALGGSELWRCGEGLGLIAHPVVSHGLVYAIDNDDGLYVFDAQTGELERSFSVEKRSDEPPVIDGDAIYMTRLDASGLFKLNKETGEVDWSFEKWGTREPVLSEGMLYLTAGESLYALDAATGGEKWRLEGVHFTPAVLAGDVFVGSPNKYLYAVDAATGAVRWKAAVGSPE